MAGPNEPHTDPTAAPPPPPGPTAIPLPTADVAPPVSVPPASVPPASVPPQYPGAPALPPIQQPPAGQAGGQYPLPGSYPTVPPFPGPVPQRARGRSRLAQTGIGVAVAVGLLVLRVVFTANHSDSNQASHVNLADPWASTASASYPIDAAGIELPTATAVDGFTVDEVTADLRTVKKILTAGRLDNTLLVNHDPSVLLGLLAPAYRPKAQSRFDTHEFTYYGTQIAPGQTLAGAVREKGTITFSGRKNPNDVRVLDITTNFVWVYAFDGTRKEPGDHLVSIHDTNTWEFPSAQDVDADQLGAWVHELNYSVYNMDCALLDQDYLGLGKPVDLPPDSTADPRAEDAKALDPNTPVDTNVGAGTC